MSYGGLLAAWASMSCLSCLMIMFCDQETVLLKKLKHTVTYWVAIVVWFASYITICGVTVWFILSHSINTTVNYAPWVIIGGVFTMANVVLSTGIGGCKFQEWLES